MQKWEYLRIRTDLVRVYSIADKPLLGDNTPKPHLDSYVAQLGDEGWELVALLTTRTEGVIWVFKRPKV
jgi:hypothetical protein